MAMRRKGNPLHWGLHLKELAPRSWESHLCLVKLARETTLKNTCIPISQDYKEFTITCVLKKVPWRKIGEHSLSPFVSENFSSLFVFTSLLWSLLKICIVSAFTIRPWTPWEHGPSLSHLWLHFLHLAWSPSREKEPLTAWLSSNTLITSFKLHHICGNFPLWDIPGSSPLRNVMLCEDWDL